MMEKKKRTTPSKTLEAFKLVSEIEDSLYQLAEIIEKAPDRETADAMFGELSSSTLGISFSNDFWDYWIDWDKVVWNDEIV